MQHIATITSKRQLTIPVDIFQKAGLKSGQKVMINFFNNQLILKPAEDPVEQLAGSVTVPAKFKKMNPDQIITQVKKDYSKQIRLSNT